MERVQKILSQYGIASRRQAEQMMMAGRVAVNGETVKLGHKIDCQRDQITVDGQLLKPNHRPKTLYLLVNKPRGVVCTCRDPQNRATILDLLPASLKQGQGLHPVGRLDWHSTGAMILTNDGNLTLHLTHPRYHLPKTYQVWVKGRPPESVLQQWRHGVILDGKPTLPAQVALLKCQRKRTLLQIVLSEGRNRQIRRIADQLGFPVLALHRSAIGNVQLHRDDQWHVEKGNYRWLTQQEIHDLQGHLFKT